MTLPIISHEAKGVFLPALRSESLSTVHDASGSNIQTSAGEPMDREPATIPAILAGAEVKAATAC